MTTVKIKDPIYDRKRKTKLNATYSLIEKLTKKYGRVTLKVHQRSYFSREYHLYGTRYLSKSGHCSVNHPGNGSRKRSQCCFEESTSVFSNDFGEYFEIKDLRRTMVAMQQHDRGELKIKEIHAGGWIYYP